MHVRTKLAKGLVRLGEFISSLALMVMRPENLEEYSKEEYSRENIVASYSHEDFVDQGLTKEESRLIQEVPLTSGRVLVLGMGGGRDAIALARLGFQVVGTDYVPEMVNHALENARRCGVALEGVVQEFNALDFPPASFDAVILFAGMYSAITMRQRRIAFLKRVRQVLKPGGFFVCTFFFQEDPVGRRGAEWVRKALAYVTRGNLTYERGDVLFGRGHVFHFFNEEKEITQEFAAAGLKVRALHLIHVATLSGAVVQAPEREA